ncbi:MAG: glycogen debranching protein GlgX, partial [Gaiellaceae bacterium]|nr:glycogen debranching protein GlgX [Gaiellaceae bacterium]
YARAIDGVVDHRAGPTLPYVPTGAPDADLGRDDRDDAAAIPKAVVIDPAFDWEDDEPPRTRWEDTVLYELHVKGFTQRHPDVPEHLRGTFAGLASEAAIAHLVGLGVTAVELMPIQQKADEPFLVERGLTNYWGYSPIGFLAPHAAYAATGTRGEQVREVKGLVQALHRAGIEVILDVVYNHTAEGNHLGPMLSFKGIDNASYYRLAPDGRHYVDVTGTGNTLDLAHPTVRRLVLDSLRSWVLEYHVDGFRFDLAVALTREGEAFEPGESLLQAIAEDPVLSQVKLIAEPWDLGPGGYRLGAFPTPWAEWNDRYRDAVRDLWRGRSTVAELARRLTGSSDLFGARGPCASINYVTSHDGLTLADLVSYERKRNEANLEGGRDGPEDDRSWNCGVEGPTVDHAIRSLRARQQRNLLATLLLSHGVPLLLGGDEIGRTQGGNNNAWCQDNELSWLEWELDPGQESLLAFTRRLLELRRRHPVFRRSSFLEGRGSGALPDACWLRPDGREMRERDWESPDLRSVGLFLNGEELPGDVAGPPGRDASFLLLVNVSQKPVRFTLPPRRLGVSWRVELETARPERPPTTAPAGSRLELEGRSLVLLRREG